MLDIHAGLSDSDGSASIAVFARQPGLAWPCDSFLCSGPERVRPTSREFSYHHPSSPISDLKLVEHPELAGGTLREAPMAQATTPFPSPAARPAQTPAVPPPGGVNANRTMSAAGQVALAQREGQVAGAGYYNDSASNCTFGVGLLVHAGPCTAAELARPVDAAQARAEFQRRMSAAAQRVRDQVQSRALTQNQFDALVSATYNTRTQDNQAFLASANHPDDAAVVRQLGELVHTHNHDANGRAVGPAIRSQGLVNRRNGEIRQFQTP